MVDLTGLASVVFGGVTLHNVLQYAVKRVTAPLNKVAADVESGNVKALEHDAAGVADFVETHVPVVAKAVDEARAEAERLVTEARHNAAEELRKLAEAVEKATGTAPTEPASPAPQAPSTPPQG